MQRRMFLAASTAMAAVSMIPASAAAQATASQGSASPTAANPLTKPWTGPYGGVPPFDQVKIADFKPGLEAAIAEELAEVDAIANNPAAPTFDNTIAALERTGKTGDRIGTIYDIWSGTLSTPEMRAIETEMAPKLAAYNDKILQNEKLFRRIEAVYEARDKAGLTPEQKRLTWLRWNSFVRAGAKLSPEAKARVAAINKELAGLFTTFNQNLLADETDYVLYLDEKDLAGLPHDVREAAAQAAKEHGKPGQYAILNTRSSMDPFLTYSDRRDLREKVWRTFYARGDNRDAKDNNEIIKKILKLRAERAKLRGYPTHAHWRLDDAMAKTPEHAMDLMMRVWPSAVARVHEEVAEMQAVADKQGAGIKIAPWDYRYYAEKVR
ncbi:MAG TPA: M3 family metallopeptidase, partial [Phenylobacterium sp.]